MEKLYCKDVSDYEVIKTMSLGLTRLIFIDPVDLSQVLVDTDEQFASPTIETCQNNTYRSNICEFIARTHYKFLHLHVSAEKRIELAKFFDKLTCGFNLSLISYVGIGTDLFRIKNIQHEDIEMSVEWYNSDRNQDLSINLTHKTLEFLNLINE